MLVSRGIGAGLMESTAAQRAKQTLGWREQLLAPQSELPLRTPSGVREEPVAYAPVSSGAVLSVLRLRDFKSFVDETIPFGPLTVFVGANASGKSNTLDAIQLLQGLALGHSVEEVLQGRCSRFPKKRAPLRWCSLAPKGVRGRWPDA